MISRIPNTNNFQIEIFNLLMGPKQVLPLLVRVGLGVMTTKGWLDDPQNSTTGASPPDAV